MFRLMLAMPLFPLQVSMEGQLIELRHNFPVDTRRHFNVYKTSIPRRRRRIDVLEALERCLSTGLRISVTESK